jgi:hypothetical protein
MSRSSELDVVSEAVVTKRSRVWSRGPWRMSKSFEGCLAEERRRGRDGADV